MHTYIYIIHTHIHTYNNDTSLQGIVFILCMCMYVYTIRYDIQPCCPVLLSWCFPPVAVWASSCSHNNSGDRLKVGEATKIQPTTNNSNALHLFPERFRSIYTTENAAVVKIFNYNDEMIQKAFKYCMRTTDK